jgi:phosphorylcholine metabolism protein LicD
MQDLKVTHIDGFQIKKLGDVSNIQITFDAIKQQIHQQWWISSGTAIGLYRDKDVIKDDTDIDIGILSKSGQVHIELDMKLVRKMDWKGIPIQTVYVDTRNNCLVDIYYYYSDILENKLFSISEYGWVYYKTPYIIKPLFKIKELDTKYGALPFLDPVEEYLTDRFGDWKTPSNSKGRYYKSLTS